MAPSAPPMAPTIRQQAYGAPAPGMPGQLPGHLPGGMGIHGPRGHTPQVPLPVSTYHGSETGRPGVPIDPWRRGLRVMMIVWGAVMLAAVATPVSTDPLVFQWDQIMARQGTPEIIIMMFGAIGLLGLLLGLIPMITLPRGIFAALLGLAGFVVPIVLDGELPDWRHLMKLVAALCLVSGLLVRNEYTDSVLARILVTFGAACALLPYLVPADGQIVLIEDFKQVINLGGTDKVPALLVLAHLVIVLMSLLAWVPSPATGGAKVFAWLIIGWAAVIAYTFLALDANIVTKIKTAPFDALVRWVPDTVCQVLAGYGIAAVIGKQLE
jgi:hypothetical protein